MRLALLTDIHANLEAFESVLADISLRGCHRTAILGDIVGYGPDPEWCCDRVMNLVAAGAICVQGNHDAAIAHGTDGMVGNARKSIDWTRPRLTEAQRGFLAELPLTATLGEIQICHSSPEAPLDWIYITTEVAASGALRASRARLVFCGHVHVPTLFAADLTGLVRGQRFKIGVALPLMAEARAVAGTPAPASSGAPRPLRSCSCDSR